MGFFSNLFKNQKESASAPTKSEPLPLELQMESLFATVALVGLAMLDFKFDFHNIHDEGPGYYGIKNTHDDSTRRRRKQWARKRKRDETIVHYQLLLDYWPDGGETVVVPSRPPKNDFVALMGALAECDQAIRSRRLSPREAAELVKSKTFLVRDFCENYESGTSALLGTHLRTDGALAEATLIHTLCRIDGTKPSIDKDQSKALPKGWEKWDWSRLGPDGPGLFNDFENYAHTFVKRLWKLKEAEDGKVQDHEKELKELEVMLAYSRKISDKIWIAFACLQAKQKEVGGNTVRLARGDVLRYERRAELEKGERLWESLKYAPTREELDGPESDGCVHAPFRNPSSAGPVYKHSASSSRSLSSSNSSSGTGTIIAKRSDSSMKVQVIATKHSNASLRPSHKDGHQPHPPPKLSTKKSLPNLKSGSHAVYLHRNSPSMPDLTKPPPLPMRGRQAAVYGIQHAACFNDIHGNEEEDLF